MEKTSKTNSRKNQRGSAAGSYNNKTNPITGKELSKHIASQGQAQLMYGLALDPSVNCIVKKLKRWAIYRGLAQTALLIAGLFFVNNL